MHPDVKNALNWSNSSSRNRLLRKLEGNNTISKEDVAEAKLVLQIRYKLNQEKTFNRQDNALEELREKYDLSRKRFQKLCRLASVCIKDGEWYDDLRKRLKQSEYRVPKETLKEYSHLKLCMLVSV